MAQYASPPSDFQAPFVPDSASPFDARRISHLLRRAAFGPTVELLERFRGKKPADALDWLFNYDPAIDPLGDMLEKLEGFLWPFKQIQTAQEWWIYRMLNTPRPLEERVALFWHGHFATSATKVQRSILMHNQIDLFRRKGLGSYRELLIAVGRDPAMLIWLDGKDSRKGKPNENYAREVMELFSLGIGQYTEQDVKELARAFTGWQLRGDGSFFNKSQHDEGEKAIFGRKGVFDDDGAVDLLLSRPTAPRFVARKLLRQFVHPQPLEEHVEHYARRLLAQRWQIKPVLREMLASRLFFSDWAYRSRIKSPCDLVIGATQAVGGKVTTAFVRETLDRLGQSLMAPPTVKGWDGEEAWINANTVLQRFSFGLTLATQRGAEFVRKAELGEWLESRQITSGEAIVDHYARLLLDGRIPNEHRTRLLDYLNRDGKNKSATFVLSAESVNAKVKGILHLMMATPEFQLA